MFFIKKLKKISKQLLSKAMKLCFIFGRFFPSLDIVTKCSVFIWWLRRKTRVPIKRMHSLQESKCEVTKVACLVKKCLV